MTTGCSGVAQVAGLEQPPIGELEDLQVFCQGIGEEYSEAAEYSGSGPHAPAMFVEAAAADTDTNAGPT